MAQNSYFRLPGGHRFWPKSYLTVMAPNHGGDPLGSYLVQMGSHWVQKMGQNHKKLPCPKIRILTTQQSSISTKIRPYGYGAKSRWGPLGFILVPMGSHWVKKRGQNHKKLPCPQIRILDYPTIIDHRFRPKSNFTVIAPNHGGDPLGSILGPMGSYWVQKMGQSRKNLPCP